MASARNGGGFGVSRQLFSSDTSRTEEGNCDHQSKVCTVQHSSLQLDKSGEDSPASVAADGGEDSKVGDLDLHRLQTIRGRPCRSFA
jgi:hypothetical protein